MFVTFLQTFWNWERGSHFCCLKKKKLKLFLFFFNVIDAFVQNASKSHCEPTGSSSGLLWMFCVCCILVYGFEALFSIDETGEGRKHVE